MQAFSLYTLAALNHGDTFHREAIPQPKLRDKKKGWQTLWHVYYTFQHEEEYKIFFYLPLLTHASDSVCKMGIAILSHLRSLLEIWISRYSCKNHKSKYVSIQTVRINIIQYWTYHPTTWNTLIPFLRFTQLELI